MLFKIAVFSYFIKKKKEIFCGYHFYKLPLWKFSQKWIRENMIIDKDKNKDFFYLQELKIPSYVMLNRNSNTYLPYVFCDASYKVCATCIYLRCKIETEVSRQLVQACARVTKKS